MALDSKMLENYRKLDWEGALRKDLGVSGELVQGKASFNRIKNLFDRLIQSSSSGKLLSEHEKIFSPLLGRLISFINNDVLNTYTDSSRRNEMLQRIKSQEGDFVRELAPIFNYLLVIENEDKFDYKGEVAKAERSVAELKYIVDKVKKMLAENQMVAKGQEINKFGTFFKEMANDNQISAKSNSKKMYVFLFLTVLLAAIFVLGERYSFQENKSWLENILFIIISQSVILKLFILSAGGYLVAHFSRNFKAEKHLYYLNMHRHNILSSHERIVGATLETHNSNNDLETKNEILIHATRAMFEIHESGYLNDGGSPVPTTQIIEKIISKS